MSQENGKSQGNGMSQESGTSQENGMSKGNRMSPKRWNVPRKWNVPKRWIVPGKWNVPRKCNAHGNGTECPKKVECLSVRVVVTTRSDERAKDNSCSVRHSQHRFAAPSFLDAGCRKPVLGVWQCASAWLGCWTVNPIA